MRRSSKEEQWGGAARRDGEEKRCTLSMMAAAASTRGFSCIRGFHVPVVDSRTRRAAVLSLLLRGRVGPEERAVLSDPREISARAGHAMRLPIA